MEVKAGRDSANDWASFFQMHQRFEEVERIWREEFTILVNHLKEQQCALPCTLAYKLFTKAQLDSTVTEALEIVKENYSKVDMSQSKYRYRQEANDRANKDLA